MPGTWAEGRWWAWARGLCCPLPPWGDHCVDSALGPMNFPHLLGAGRLLGLVPVLKWPSLGFVAKPVSALASRRSRGCWPEQTAFNHQEHCQAGPGDRGAAPRPGDSGGGQGDPAGPAEQRADTEGPGNGECSGSASPGLFGKRLWPGLCLPADLGASVCPWPSGEEATRCQA